MMERFVYFDLETIPSQSPAYLERVRGKIKPPGNIKKAESIATWMAENAEQAAIEKVAESSFDGGRGHICTIAWAKDDGEVQCFHAATLADEKPLVAAFFNALDPYHSEILVGHNILGFDIGFLRKRAIALGVKLPGPTSFPRDPKPWDKKIHDTMVMWAGSGNRVSMDDLCDILGIPGKDGFDGSMVADAWRNGEHAKIAEYCAADVARTREIHKRFLAAGW
jgi:predicted PolB exonuclease-like 3'-5' exonuclease